jgi:putative ABC transport system substrate-binding protein
MTLTITRRQFAVALSGATAWPFAAGGQATGKLPTIGFLGSVSPNLNQSYATVFTQRLNELGWIDGRSVKIEARWAQGRSERIAPIVAEFVALKVNVIVSGGTAVSTLMRATSVIPIVFTSTIDPVATGYVASLAHPGGNVTGLSLQATDTVGKRLEFLREVVPGLHQLAVINVRNPGNELETHEVQAQADKIGIETSSFEIGRSEDIAPAFEAFRDKVQAIYVINSPLTAFNRVRINTMSLGARLPAIHNGREFVEAGGLMSYGPDLSAIYRRAADYVDKILRGTKPADLPVEQPTKFNLTINLTTAKTLGVTVPDKLLALADEVIE